MGLKALFLLKIKILLREKTSFRSGIQRSVLIYEDGGRCRDFDIFVRKSLNSVSVAELPMMLEGCVQVNIIIPLNKITWSSHSTALFHLMEDKAWKIKKNSW